MPRARRPGRCLVEFMRDPLTPAQDYVEHAAARRIIVGVLLAMLLAALDQVMVATALPTIAVSLADVGKKRARGIVGILELDQTAAPAPVAEALPLRISHFFQ